MMLHSFAGRLSEMFFINIFEIMAVIWINTFMYSSVHSDKLSFLFGEILLYHKKGVLLYFIKKAINLIKSMILKNFKIKKGVSI